MNHWTTIGGNLYTAWALSLGEDTWLAWLFANEIEYLHDQRRATH